MQKRSSGVFWTVVIGSLCGFLGVAATLFLFIQERGKPIAQQRAEARAKGPRVILGDKAKALPASNGSPVRRPHASGDPTQDALDRTPRDLGELDQHASRLVLGTVLEPKNVYLHPEPITAADGKTWWRVEYDNEVTHPNSGKKTLTHVDVCLFIHPAHKMFDEVEETTTIAKSVKR